MRTIAIPRIILRYKTRRDKNKPSVQEGGLAAAAPSTETHKVDRVQGQSCFYSYASSPINSSYSDI